MDTRVVNFCSLPFILGLIIFGFVQPGTSFQCGIPRIRHEPLIVRGASTNQGEWPWHAAIFHRKEQLSEYACGGTLINYHFVLTAAHCTGNQKTGIKLSRQELFVRLGIHYLDDIDPAKMQQYLVGDVYTFGEFNKRNMRNDIALLKLEGSVKITDHVVPACINQQFNLTNDVGTSVGWGVTENNEISPVLKLTKLPVIDDIDCLESDRDLFGKLFSKGMFCAGLTNGTSLCNGDSGGGLFFKQGEAWYVGGIISFSKFRGHGSNLCYTKGYTAFTKVVKYLSWISNITGIDLDVGVGINPTPVVERKKVSDIPRITDEKCREYRQSRPSMRMPELMYYTLIIRDQKVRTCGVTIISERYLLGTGRCFHSTFDKASFTIEQNPYMEVAHLPKLIPILHPNYTATADGYVSKDSIILIDMRSDHNELKSHIECLWTDPTEIPIDHIASGIGATQFDSNVNISETDDGKAVTTNEVVNCRAHTLTLGTRLTLRKFGQYYYRMVGPLIDCEPPTYARLTDYLDWIENTVWPRKT